MICLTGAFSLLLACLASGTVVYGVYRCFFNPREPSAPGTAFSYGFDWLGAVSFFLPLTGLAVLLGFSGTLLLHYRDELSIWPAREAPRARSAQRWAQAGEALTVNGWVPGLVVLTIVAMAEAFSTLTVQLHPPAVSIYAGPAAGVIGFLLAWAISRYLLGLPPLATFGHLVLATVLMAAGVAAAATYRYDSYSDALIAAPGSFSGAPITAGFHTVSARSVPSTSVVTPICSARSTVCAGPGTGTYYGPGLALSRPVLATSVDGGRHWSVSALPAGEITVLRPNCVGTSCQARVVGRSVTSLITAQIELGRGQQATLAERTVDGVPVFGSVACNEAHCLAFAQAPLGRVPAHFTAGVGERTFEVTYAYYSSDGGRTWARSELPRPPAISSKLGAKSILNPAQGPWCTTALDCSGAETVQTPACAHLGAGKACTSALTMVYTDDGGTHWSHKTFAPRKPAAADYECSGNGTCTGSGAGAIGASAPVGVVSANGGRSWKALASLPSTGAFVCWSATGCAAGGTNRYMLSTTDGGAVWAHQAITGTVRAAAPVTWCGPNGRCLAAGTKDGQGYYLFRASRSSPWVGNWFPAPSRLLGASAPAS